MAASDHGPQAGGSGACWPTRADAVAGRPADLAVSVGVVALGLRRACVGMQGFQQGIDALRRRVVSLTGGRAQFVTDQDGCERYRFVALPRTLTKRIRLVYFKVSNFQLSGFKHFKGFKKSCFVGVLGISSGYGLQRA